MTTFTRGGRNGKPSRVTKGLLDNSMQYVKNTLLGLGLLAMVSGCTTIYEKDPLVRQIVGGLPRILQPGAYRDSVEREERQKEMSYQRETYNSEERRILNQVSKMPRVVYQGDVDNNGVEDWVYHDGEGNRYWAFQAFVDDGDKFELTLSKKFYKKGFIYSDKNKNKLFDVPKNVLIIYYQK